MNIANRTLFRGVRGTDCTRGSDSQAMPAVLVGLALVAALAAGPTTTSTPITSMPAVGGWLLVIGVTLACLGLLWSDRITDRLEA